MEKVQDVFVTQDYKMFKHIEGNRSIDAINLALVRKSNKKKQLIAPILVNENYEVIDGQHRLSVWEDLNLPVYFIVIPGYGIEEIQQLNANMKKWNLTDFINSYAERGFENYILLKDFMNKYKFSPRECITLLCSKNNRVESALKAGEIEVTNYTTGVEKAEKILQVANYYDGYRRRIFVNTMLYLFEHPDYNHQFFLSQLSKQPSKLTNCFTLKAYLRVIEEIYNFNQRMGARFF